MDLFAGKIRILTILCCLNIDSLVTLLNMYPLVNLFYYQSCKSTYVLLEKIGNLLIVSVQKVHFKHVFMRRIEGIFIFEIWDENNLHFVRYLH